MNIFEMAETQLINEGKRYDVADILDYAVIIRKHLDKQDNKRAKTQFKKKS